MRIAIDAMGGDFAPCEPVNGALLYAKEFPEDTVLLFGDEEKVSAELARTNESPTNIGIVHCTQCIEMTDCPMESLKTKKDSSMTKAICAVKDGAADAILSAGNTGAQMAGSLLILGTISGLKKPGILCTMPSTKGRFILTDAGANVNCRPINLLQYGMMGALYYQHLIGPENPTVALLSLGAEENKGTELTKGAAKLLKESPVNYVGQVEGHDVFDHAADVVVTDGFTGNVLLKTAEGVGRIFLDKFKALTGQHIKDQEGVLACMKELAVAFDFNNTGGAMLGGVNGISIITHGRSERLAILSGLKLARQLHKSHFNIHLAENLSQACYA